MKLRKLGVKGGVMSVAMLTVLLSAAWPALGAMTLLPAGPMLGSHVGNLVANGSFEIGAPPPGPPFLFWATGTTSMPFAVPTGWTSFGPPANYALWGADGTVPPSGLVQSDTLPHGEAALYFGNGGAFVDMPPTFLPSREVVFPGSPTFTPIHGAPVVLRQSVPTHLAPAPAYLLSFWVSGEDAALNPMPGIEGIFGLRVTNVLAGDPIQYFAVPDSTVGVFGASTRYEFLMTPLNPLLPIDIEFYNWGHVDLTPFGKMVTTELVLDDVIVNPVPEPSAWALLASALFGGTWYWHRRRRG